MFFLVSSWVIQIQNIMIGKGSENNILWSCVVKQTFFAGRTMRFSTKRCYFKTSFVKPPIQTTLNSVSWKSNNNAYERKQDFKIVSSVRNTAVRALTAAFTGLAMCLKRTVNLPDLKSDSTSIMNRFAVFWNPNETFLRQDWKVKLFRYFICE